MPPGVTSPCCFPATHIQESLFLRELGPVAFYYGLAYRFFDLWEWVCFSLLVVSTVGWRCFSFRLGFRGGYWFMAFRPMVSSPCSFYPLYRAGDSFCVGQGQRVLAWGWREGV